ncbi:MAG: nuclear transport factor 2 family protein, partial [Mycobacterium sp.]
MSTTRVAVLATVEGSPAAVVAHDRARWVGLFTADGRVEDPVGSRPHVGTDQLERFYDTFIGPRTITFHRDVDVVTGGQERSDPGNGTGGQERSDPGNGTGGQERSDPGSTVLRDLVLEVAMGDAVTMH